MNRLSKLAALLTAGLALPYSAFADHHESPLYTQMMLSSLNASADKIGQLAAVFSEEQYAWRPMEGVNSVQEAILHVAGANYYLSNMLGTPIPEGVNARELGKDAGKDEIIMILNASVEHARKAIKNVSEEALNEEIEFFGNKAPRARLVLVLAEHGHEHLGQLIAYARTNHVVPPWSK